MEPAAAINLVRQALEGDTHALEKLVHEFHQPVYHFCLHYLGDESRAQDATVEVFLKLRSALPKFDANRPFKTWLFTVAANHCKNLLRRKRVEERLFIPLTADELSGEPLAHRNLDELLDHQQSLDRLRKAMRQLPLEYRAALTLRYEDEMSYSDIASILSMSTEHVGVVLFRAKQLLRRALAEA